MFGGDIARTNGTYTPIDSTATPDTMSSSAFNEAIPVQPPPSSGNTTVPMPTFAEFRGQMYAIFRG